MARGQSKKKSGKIESKRLDNDLYVTPHWCINILAERLERSLPEPHWVVDLGAGDGRIGNNVRSRFGWGVDCNPKAMFVEIMEGPRPKDILDKDEYLTRDVVEWFDKGEPHKWFDTSSDPFRSCPPERILYVSNPPFSLSHEFVWRTVAHVKGVHAPGSAAVFLLRADWWIGGGYTSHRRVDWFNANPPDVVIGICPRPSFTGEGSDSREYAWHVWMHGEHHGTQMEIILRDRKGKQRRNRDD